MAFQIIETNSARAALAGGRRGFGQLGFDPSSWLAKGNENLNSFIDKGMSVWDKVSGQQLQRETLQAQVLMQQAKAQQGMEMAGFWNALPWVIGGVAAVGIVTVVALKGRG